MSKSGIHIKPEKRSRTKFVQHDELGNLLCYTCGKYLSLDMFNTNKEGWYRDGKDRRCKTCKDKQRERRIALDHYRVNLDRILLSRWHGVKQRASDNGYLIDFDWDYLKHLWIIQDGKCAISGLNMTYVMFNGRIPENVSVDRINPSFGYTKDNIQLVCMAVNQMKSDMNMDQLLNFCKQIISYNEYNQNKEK
jgi:hypothetical protein